MSDLGTVKRRAVYASQDVTDVWVSNAVIKNTYLLLSMTLLFSAGVAYTAMIMNLPHPGILISLVGYFGLLFLTHALRNSVAGLLAVFAFTGFMGYTLGPILNIYLKTFINGSELIATAFTGTAIVFLSLSAYALKTKKNFNFLAGFLFAGFIVAFVASLAAIFLKMPALNLAISAAMVLLSSGFILFQTSQLIHGGETNYIIATINLYVSIYNLFLSLLQLLAALNGRQE